MRSSIEGWKNRLLSRHAPKVTNWIVARSADRARQRLLATGAVSVLIDNTTLHHAITHETAWIPAGSKPWGPHSIDTGYMARVPVHSRSSDALVYRNVCYLAGIAHLARQGLVKLHTSAELLDEQFRQSVGRFIGYGLFDLNLFGGLEIKSIDGHVFSRRDPYSQNQQSHAEQQRARLKSRESDPTYAAMLDHLGRKKNTQDAWHLLTAERHAMFCFLTMDFKFRENIRAQIKSSPLNSFRTIVLTPEEFGRTFSLRPIPPRLLSFNGDRVPVRSDLAMPAGKRRPRNGYWR